MLTKAHGECCEAQMIEAEIKRHRSLFAEMNLKEGSLELREAAQMMEEKYEIPAEPLMTLIVALAENDEALYESVDPQIRLRIFRTLLFTELGNLRRAPRHILKAQFAWDIRGAVPTPDVEEVIARHSNAHVQRIMRERQALRPGKTTN